MYVSRLARSEPRGGSEKKVALVHVYIGVCVLGCTSTRY